MCFTASDRAYGAADIFGDTFRLLCRQEDYQACFPALLQDENGVWRSPTEARYIASAKVQQSGEPEENTTELSVLKTL